MKDHAYVVAVLLSTAIATSPGCGIQLSGDVHIPTAGDPVGGGFSMGTRFLPVRADGAMFGGDLVFTVPHPGALVQLRQGLLSMGYRSQWGAYALEINTTIGLGTHPIRKRSSADIDLGLALGGRLDATFRLWGMDDEASGFSPYLIKVEFVLGVRGGFHTPFGGGPLIGGVSALAGFRFTLSSDLFASRSKVWTR